MRELMLFTDGSVNARSKIGYGAYLAVPDCGQSLAVLQCQVQLKRFEQTSSTKLELQTLLWALGEIAGGHRGVTVYTDSQNLVGLAARREGLERANYRSRNGRRLNNERLYRDFFRLTDQLDCRLVKVRGHRPAEQKTQIDKLFALVDRASRQALRSPE